MQRGRVCSRVHRASLYFINTSGALHTLLRTAACLIRANFLVRMRACACCQRCVRHFVSPVTLCVLLCIFTGVCWKTLQMLICVEMAAVLIKTPTFSSTIIYLLFISLPLRWMTAVCFICSAGVLAGGRPEKREAQEKGTQWASDCQEKRDAGDVQLNLPFIQAPDSFVNLEEINIIQH